MCSNLWHWSFLLIQWHCYFHYHKNKLSKKNNHNYVCWILHDATGLENHEPRGLGQADFVSGVFSSLSHSWVCRFNKEKKLTPYWFSQKILYVIMFKSSYNSCLLCTVRCVHKKFLLRWPNINNIYCTWSRLIAETSANNLLTFLRVQIQPGALESFC